MEKKICCIFNLAPHYRASIFKLMDKELDCDFYFGDKVESKIKKLDYSSLNNFKKETRNISILNTSFIWQVGVVHLIFKKQYKHFILTGQSNILSNHVIAFFALLLNKKVYLWMHGLRKEISWKGKVLTYPFYYMAHKFLLYSDFSKNLMEKKGFSSDKMVCIYNSLNYDLQLSIRKKLQKTSVYQNIFNNNYPVVIYIGRIQKRKKINLLIEAISILKKKSRDCNLIIVGADNENVNLQMMPTYKKLQNYIHFYGPCYDENKIGELIYNAAVCVSPGNIGLTAMHSFSYGTPAITHNNFSNQMPEFEIIKEGISGDFFEEDNVDDLAIKIQKWINISSDQREKTRLEAYKLIDERYNPHYQINVLKKIFI